MTERFEDTAYLCTIPASLGAVTKLEVKGGRVIARTESGHTMIVPQVATPAEQANKGTQDE
jgi:hypothetical protein